MEVCSRAFILTPHGEREIQLCIGDITALPLSEKVDIIIVSAFVCDYSPIPGTVIGALKRNLGIDVHALARDKKEDLRVGFNCWISHALKDVLPYRQLVCFERLLQKPEKTMSESVEQMFRALFPAFNNENKSVITPLLMTGCQQKDHAKMLRVTVNAAVEWIRLGLPLQLFKIIIYSPTPRKPSDADKRLISVFGELKKSFELAPLIVKEPQVIYDIYFVNTMPDHSLLQLVLSMLCKMKSTLKYRTLSDVTGKEDTWKHSVHQLMQQCRRIVPLLTADFLKDEVCVDQYNLALCCNRTTQRNIMAPLCFERVLLPIYMSMVQWINCRDQQPEQITSACRVLLEQTEKGKQSDERFYDVFISYSHRNMEAAKTFLSSLQSKNENLSIFFDNEQLKSGVNWQQTLYASLDSSRCMLALVSKEYICSDVCHEEFNIAMALHNAQEKQLELVVVLLDDIVSFDSIASLRPIRGNEEISKLASTTCDKICKWLANGIATNILSPVGTPLCCDSLTERWRRRCFDEFYLFNAGNFSIKTKSSHSSKKDCYKVFISHTTRNRMLANFLSLCFTLIRSDVKVHTKSTGTDAASEQEMLHSADIHVVLLSQSYVRSPRDVEELSVILSQVRTSKDNRSLYVIRVNKLPVKPTYLHLIHCDTALDDEMWKEFATTNGESVRKEFTLAQNKVEDKEMKMKKSEMMAMLKAFADITWKLRHKRNLPSDKNPFLLLNVVDLNRELGGNTQRRSTSTTELQPNVNEDDAQTIQQKEEEEEEKGENSIPEERKTGKDDSVNSVESSAHPAFAMKKSSSCCLI